MTTSRPKRVCRAGRASAAAGAARRPWEEAGVRLAGRMRGDGDPMLFARVGFDLAKEELKTYGGLFLLTFDMFGVGLHTPKIATAASAFIAKRRPFAARITEAGSPGLAAPPLASADAIAAAIWGSLHGIYLQKVMNPEFDADAAIDALSEMTIAFATRPRDTSREEG